MGNSLQDYRSKIGLYHGSANSFRVRKSYQPTKYLKIKPKMKILMIAMLICMSWPCSNNMEYFQKSESASRPQYSSLSSNQSLPVHHDLGGALHHHHHQGGAAGYQSRNCEFLTKSTNIENYNFLARYTNGNGRGSGLKLCHWNKGASYLINSMNVIEQVIDQYRPHILGVSESNFYSTHSLEDVQIDNYNLFLADTLKNPNLQVSRVAVYVHKDIIVKVRDDLMTNDVS